MIHHFSHVSSVNLQW